MSIDHSECGVHSLGSWPCCGQVVSRLIRKCISSEHLPLGAPVTISDAGIHYRLPDAPDDEWEFLCGWHNGCPGAIQMVAKALHENADLRNAHLAAVELSSLSPH